MADETPTPPGAGGWLPTPGQRVALTLLAVVLGGCAPVLMAKPLDAQALIAAAVSGLSLGLATLLGLSSAGPRKP